MKTALLLRSGHSDDAAREARAGVPRGLSAEVVGVGVDDDPSTDYAVRTLERQARIEQLQSGIAFLVRDDVPEVADVPVLTFMPASVRVRVTFPLTCISGVEPDQRGAERALSRVAGKTPAISDF